MIRTIFTCTLFSLAALVPASHLSAAANTQNTAALDITACGAVPGGEKLCTESIQKAIDNCTASGGGCVIVPGGNWLTGTLVMKNNVELHLAHGATLIASTNHVDFPTFQPEYRSHKDINGFNALIYAEKAENIAITGTGIIDGRGAYQRPREGKQFRSDRDGRPRNILFVSCNNIRVTGITLKDSGVWNQHYLDCEDVIVDRILVSNHSNRNNDGIDIDGCRRFILSNSIIDSDDDGICLKSTGPAPCEHISIINCIVSSHCNAIKTGTESTGGFRHVNISNCIVKPSTSKEKVVYGFKEGITGITVGCVDGGICENININNIVIEGTQVPIFIRLGKRNRSHTSGATVTKDSTMKNISISNISATGCSGEGCAILGLPGNPIHNLNLNNINITFAGGGTQEDTQRVVPELLTKYPQSTVWGKMPAYGFFIRNADKVRLQSLDLQVAEKDLRSPIWLENINGLEVNSISADKADTEMPLMIQKNVN
ncbi:MAG: glycosyl hydrolase family 28 protein [Kiritimatiellae bacterium]|nr:glycosyl hydrolase family 28 protein [Kiritimatiellia bacterium]